MPRAPCKTPPTATSASRVRCPVERYARRVVARKTVAGPLVRAACARHLRDLEEGPARGLVWDKAAALWAIEFFPRVLFLPEGDRAPFVLQPWQQFIVGSLFGWKSADGFRRFRNAYVEVGKGNGKSPMAAGIGLYMLRFDHEDGAQVFAAAVTRDQAKIMFTDAVKMVEASPRLAGELDKHVINLAHVASGSFFRPVSSEGRALDGLRVHCGLIDEIHEHRTDVVVEKIRAGTKGRRQALIVEITNSGVDRQSICWQHHDYSARVVNQVADDDSWFAYVAGLDDGDDYRDDAVWIKANPNLGVSITHKYLAEQVREAKGMPAKESRVRRLNFCEWVDAADPWIDQHIWRACEAEFDPAELRGRTCWGGLDLSSKRDLTALALVFPDDDGGLDALVEFWSPGETLAERAARDQAHYDLWARQGHLHAPPGKTIDYGFVVERLAELAADYDIEMIAFDPWRREDLERALDAEAVTLPLKPHGQGFQGGDRADRLWMPRSVEKLEEAILQGRLRVRANPVLFWCASSAVIESDPKGNRIFSKRRATGRIDGVVALAMAVGAATAHSTVVSSIYNDPSAWDDEPRASDGGLPDQAILDDPKHPLWHEHRRRYEERLAMMDGEDRWI